MNPLPDRSAPRVSARAVLTDQLDRLLLVRHQNADRDFHVLPGGRLEPGETAAEAARREMLEETGLRVVIGDLLWVREFLPERHPGDPHHTTVRQQLQLIFRAALGPGAEQSAPLQPDPTQTDLVWQPLTALDAVTLVPVGLAGPLAELGRGHSPVYLGDLA
ncbi:NUDIX domain-containing protein [Streptacidiphilus fuscans]|uniref:NUDIX domain-containing protein n=1 Tax=Streptacidiphilus fuscans TaxID=2789292 RepID=A0A931AY31_9ACTN|nr:NUDIX domain-containing protein [Streptacidiphilus fuscans]MBF9066673.1 NUDIX domain-containing protein [Streptacidiphilus fuscans]